DSKASADEVAAIIGAPKMAVVMTIVEALHAKDAEKALGAIRTAVEANTDMKLFARLILERLRAILLTRHSPADGKAMLEEVGEEDAKRLEAMAKDAKSPINSALLSR